MKAILELHKSSVRKDILTILSLSFLFLVLLVCLSCGDNPEESIDNSTENLSQSRNIVRIKSQFCTSEDFNNYLLYETLNLEEIELNEEILSFYLERFIEHKLLLQESKKHNIRVSDKELQSKIESLRKYISTDMEDVQKTKSLIDDKDWIRHLRDTLIVQKYVEIVLTAAVVVNQEEEKDYYNKHYKNIPSKRSYRLSQIVLLDENLAMEILEKLKKNPRKFPELAMKYSSTPSAKMKGDIGWYTLRQLPEYIQKEVVKLRKGRISGIIESENGYLIIQLTDRKMDKKPSFYEIRESIRAKLLQEKREEYLNEHIKNVWKEERSEDKGISIFQDNLNFIYTPIKKYN